MTEPAIEQSEISESGIEQSTEIIDAETAKKYLEVNTVNRPLRARHIHNLAADMVEGRWRFTPDPVIFRNDGALMNGQHRLSAIVVANKSPDIEEPIAIKMAVTRGLDEESWAYIDRGIKRTTADEFARNGVRNAPLMSSSARLLWRYEHNHWPKDMRTADDELLKYVTDFHPDLAKAVSAGQRLAREVEIPGSVATTCLYLSRSADLTGTGLAHADWEAQIIDGLGFSDYYAPARQLRRQLANRRANSIKTSQRIYMTLYAKAFRAWARGKDVKMFKAPRDADPVPSIEYPFT